MVREIFDRFLAVIVGYVVGLGQRVATAAVLIVLLAAGLVAFFGVLFGVVAIYALVGSPPGLAAFAGIIAFGGGLVVASIVVIKLVRWGARHLPASAETPPSEANPAERTQVMATVAALDRHLATPADGAATRDASTRDEPRRT